MIDDIRVLTAISWTYIIVAESIGSTGGIGAAIWRVGIRQGRVDKVFAMLIIIMAIGMLQDKIFAHLDRVLFPHKYHGQKAHGKLATQSTGWWHLISDFVSGIGIWILIALYLLMAIDQITPLFGAASLLPYLFGDTTAAIHIIMLTVLGYQVYRYLGTRPQQLQEVSR